MIEREFIRTKIKNLRIRARINEVVTKGAACGQIVIEKTPLGEKIIVNTIRPGIVIGRGGETIKALTSELKARYGMENPQIEVREILKPNLVAATVAKRIADELERFGPQRVKAMGYRSLNNILRDGAMGAEITISGRGIPSQRSKTHRFYGGYLKKCGDIAVSKIDIAIERANLRSGAIGIVVKIMLPNTFIPDRIIITEPVKIEETATIPKEVKEIVEAKEAPKVEKEPAKTVEKKVSAKVVPAKKTPVKKAPAKKAPAKKAEVKKPAVKKKAPAKNPETKLSQMKPSTAVAEADKKPKRKNKEVAKK